MEESDLCFFKSLSKSARHKIKLYPEFTALQVQMRSVRTVYSENTDKVSLYSVVYCAV